MGASASAGVVEAEGLSGDGLAEVLATVVPSAGEWDRLVAGRESLSDRGVVDAVVAVERLARHVAGLGVWLWGLAGSRRAEAPPGGVGELRNCGDVEALAALLGLTPGQVVERLDLSQLLVSRHPRTVRLVEGGEVRFEQAKKLADVTGCLDEEVAREVESRVLPDLPGQRLLTGDKAMRRAVAVLDGEGDYKRHQAEKKQRKLVLRPRAAGMASLELYTTAENAAALMAVVDSIARGGGAVAGPEAEADSGDGNGAGRTLDQRRADAITDLVMGAAGAWSPLLATTGSAATATVTGLAGMAGSAEPAPAPAPAPAARATGSSDARAPGAASSSGTTAPPAPTAPTAPPAPTGSPAPTGPVSNFATQGSDKMPSAVVHVLVDFKTLIGLDDSPAELVGTGPIHPVTARALAFAPGSVWRRMIVDSDTGRLIAADPHTYRPNASTDRYVRARDRHCTFPGCARPAEVCDLDHAEEFNHRNPSRGGPTAEHNLHPLCRHHHRLKTLGLWTVRRDHATGLIIWTSRTGHQIIVPRIDHRESAWAA